MDPRADDYYFNFSSDGKKIYYYRPTNKRIAKDKIPKNIIELIKTYDGLDNLVELTKTRNGYLKELKRVQDNIAEIDLKISKLNVSDPTGEELKKAEEKLEEDGKKREEELKQRQKKWEEELEQRKQKRKIEKDQWEEYLRGMYSNFFDKKKVNQSSQKDILKIYGITNVKEWKKWLMKNHPDKNGNINLDICQQIIKAGKDIGY